jgi:hypothetical protein
MTLAGFEPTTCTAFKPNSIRYAIMLHGSAVRELRMSFSSHHDHLYNYDFAGLEPVGGVLCADLGGGGKFGHGAPSP